MKRRVALVLSVMVMIVNLYGEVKAEKIVITTPTKEEMQITLDVIKHKTTKCEPQIKRTSLKLLKIINNKAINELVFKTPRESHRKHIEELEEEKE